MRIELTKYGFANRPVSHSGTSPHHAQQSMVQGVASGRIVCQHLAMSIPTSNPPVSPGSSEWLLIEESLRRLRMDLAQGRDSRAAYQALSVAERSLLLFPLRPLLEELCEISADEAELRIELPDELEVPRQWEGLLSEFAVESMRNWRAHGRESRAERKFLNKSEVYRISLGVRLAQGRLTVQFDDDGPGIHPALVLQKAEDLELFAAGERAAIEEQLRKGNSEPVHQLLFKDGLTTRPSADFTAGRGMGLARLAQEAGRLGARISARSSALMGGLCLVLELPCKVMGLRAQALESVPGVTGILCQPAGVGSFRIFSLSPPEAAAWSRDHFGGRKVSWISVEPMSSAFVAAGLVEET